MVAHSLGLDADGKTAGESEAKKEERRRFFMLRNRNHYTISFLAAYRFKKISINIEESAQIDVRLVHLRGSQEHVNFHNCVRIHPRQLGHEDFLLKNGFHVK